MNSEPPNSNGLAPEQPPHANRRPENVAMLLFQGDVHPTWGLANRQKLRFFVINLEHVLSQMNLPHTSSKPYFVRAKEEIIDKTAWKSQQPSDYQCSHTQIFPNKLRTAKYFGHAAALIVAMELAALDKRPDLNVYDFLRILPAQFYVDQFDRKRLEELAAYHSGLKPEERMQKFGADFADKPFAETCASKIEQERRPELLGQMADGYCATRYTADRLLEFINAHYPPDLHVGPVRSSGEEEANTEGLGTKNAAPQLRVRRSFPREQLPPCF